MHKKKIYFFIFMLIVSYVAIYYITYSLEKIENEKKIKKYLKIIDYEKTT